MYETMAPVTRKILYYVADRGTVTTKEVDTALNLDHRYSGQYLRQFALNGWVEKDDSVWPRRWTITTAGREKVNSSLRTHRLQ